MPLQLKPPHVSWFHLSNDETSRAREFLRSCNGEDAVDELGFGIIRDGFSEEFFPGTSTIMTEPRYLIFVPAFYRAMERALERRKNAIPDPVKRSLELQDQLRDVLSATFGGLRGHGVIGISRKDLQRYPSAIYWASLRTLGILRFSNSENDYLAWLQNHHELSQTDENHGDPVAEVAPPPINWDPHFVYYKSGNPILGAGDRFVDKLDFELTVEEACYLRDRYLDVDKSSSPAHGVHRSLLAYLIDKRRKLDFTYPWDVTPPAHLKEAVDDAKHFSILARGATLQYYYWLIKARRDAGMSVPEKNMEAQFTLWWDEGRPLLLGWDEEAFLKRRVKDIRVVRNDAKFLRSWLRHCRKAKTAQGFLNESDVRDLIVERERVCKPKKARLTHPKHLQSWNRELPEFDTPYQHNFRSPIGALFVKRIVSGLESDKESVS
jgi:hypothetical protein